MALIFKTPSLVRRVYHDDLFEVLPTLDEDSLDACVTDPPYGLEFMGKQWDSHRDQTFHRRWAKFVYRVLKPGAYLLVFGGTRSFHRMTCGIEDAGFEIRDCLMWLYGTGFPKSLNIQQAMNKDHAGFPQGGPDPTSPNHGKFKGGCTEDSPTGQGFGAGAGSFMQEQGKGRGHDAGPWQGWGTALKPAWEPIILARKPLRGTVAENVLEYGTGGLNIDATRILGPNLIQGRWPANVLLDEEAAVQLDAQTGNLGVSSGGRKANISTTSTIYGGGKGLGQDLSPDAVRGDPGYGDSGGPSRFFYCAKPSRTERDLGCEALPERSGGEATDRIDGTEGLNSPRAGAGRTGGSRNTHPTVKPLALMRYLVRLITPPGGIVLDPFLGSGTTAMACVDEGVGYIGVEREAQYVEIAKARIAACE